MTPGNDAPVADNDTLTTQMGTPGSVDVLAGDVDVLTSEAGSGAIRPRLRRLQRGDGRLHVHAVSVTVEERNSSPSCANVKPSKKKLWRSTSSS